MDDYVLAGDTLFAFAFADQLARGLNSPHVGPEHILLAMLKRPGGRLPPLASAMHFDLNSLCQQLQNGLRAKSGSSPAGKLPTSADAKKIRELAVSECRRLGHFEVCSEHVWLAMLLHHTDPATPVLEAAGLTADRVSRTIARLDFLSGVPSPESTADDAYSAERRLAELRQQVQDWRECQETRSLIKSVKAQAARHGLSAAKSPELKAWLVLASRLASELDPRTQILGLLLPKSAG